MERRENDAQLEELSHYRKNKWLHIEVHEDDVILSQHRDPSYALLFARRSLLAIITEYPAILLTLVGNRGVVGDVTSLPKSSGDVLESSGP